MAETVRIEIPIETIDNTDPELSKATKNLDKLGDAAKKAGDSVKKTNDTVTKFDKTAQKTQKSLLAWAKEKYEILLEAKDKIGPLLTTLGGKLKGITGKAWGITMKAVDFATAPIRGVINLLKNPILQVGAVLGVSIGMKDTIDTYKNFEAAMSQVKAVSGASADQMVQLTEKAKEMGATTKFTATEAGEAFNYMAMAGWKAGDMMNGIEGILNLAAASGEDLGRTSDIVTDALTAFGLTAGDATHFSDVLARAASNANTNVSMMGETFKYAGAMAGTLGYSIEDVGLMVGLMANSGIKASQAGTQLNSMFTRLSTDTNGARSAIEKLGIRFFDSNGKARALSDVMGELRKATANYTDEQKTNLANTIAGTRAQASLLAILNTSEKDYKKLAESINNADGAAAEMADTMLDNLSGSITLLQSAMDGVKISFGERLSPYIRGIADWLTNSMPEIESGLDELMDCVDIKIEKMKKKFGEITQTEEWGDADFFGKAHILWDEFISEPFSEWWNTTGKARFAGIAEDMGQGIGSGLKFGILTFLGIDIPETVNEGTSIGKSFAEGFSFGIDFGLIKDKLWEGLKNLTSDAGKLLPGGESAGLSSVLSAVILKKLLTPVFDFGKGAFSARKVLFGNWDGELGLGRKIVGSAAAGTGLKGLGATLGMTGLKLGSGATTGAGLIGAGAAGVAGGLMGGTTLISSAVDAYKALKSDNKDESKAYGESAAWKAGGVAAGAAAGAAIGSIIPGLGTAVGALVGAGIGGLGGWIKGNKVKKEYQDNVEEMQKQAELAQKAFEVTGLSIDDVKFKNKALNDAMHDSEVTAQELALMVQEECAKTMKNAFGDVHLSLEEIKKIAEEITFADASESVKQFAKASNDAKGSLNTLDNAVQFLKKENWKVGLGLELEEQDKDAYKKAIDTFVKSATEYIDNSHYQATVALSLLTDGSGDVTGIDNLYQSMKTQVESIAEKLAGDLEIALQDGVIDLDESKELLNLQQQISDITSKLSEAQEEASLEALKIKYTGAELDAESFTRLQEELKVQMEEFQDNYDEALTVSLTNLKLQLSEGAITQEQYDTMVQELKDNYAIQINGMSARIETFNFETIAEAWSAELDGILPEIQGTTAEKLSSALHGALLSNPDAASWTAEEVKEWFGLGSLASSNQEAFQNIYAELKAAAEAVPTETKETILQNYKDMVPTAEEIEAAIDWDSMTLDDWGAMMEKITGPVEGATFSVPAEDRAKPMAEYYGDYFESVKESYSVALENALTECENMDTLNTFLEENMKASADSFDFSSIMAQYGPISNEYYSQIVSEYQTAGTAFGDSMNTGASNSLLKGSSLLRTSAQTAINSAFANPFSIQAKINVTGNYNLLNPYTPPSAAGKKATGGYVSGRQLSWVGEEGPEAIIPLIPSRRNRALDLYEQVGKKLGVTKHADGGFVGGSNSVYNYSDYNLFNEAFKNVPIGYNERTDDSVEVQTVGSNEPMTVTPNTSQGNTGTAIQVSVQMTPEFNISGSDGVSEESIMAIIRKSMKTMADELGGEIAERLEEVFSNMPLKEA